jgi:hypothetical protein
VTDRILGRTATVIAAAAALAALAPVAQALPAGHQNGAVTQTAAARLPAGLTVGGYKTYLKKNWANGGRETAAAFNKLTPAQQKKFLRHLENRKIHAALQDTVKGNFGRRLHITDAYNKDVKFVTDVTSRIGKDKFGTATLSFSVSERIFNIPVTTETVTVTFETRGHAKNKNAHAKATLQNVNAAVAVKASHVKAVSKGVVTNGTAVWTATPQVKAFGAKKIVKNHLAKAAITKTGNYFNGTLGNQ